jgi:hypothetical protein
MICAICRSKRKRAEDHFCFFLSWKNTQKPPRFNIGLTQHQKNSKMLKNAKKWIFLIFLKKYFPHFSHFSIFLKYSRFFVTNCSLDDIIK